MSRKSYPIPVELKKEHKLDKVRKVWNIGRKPIYPFQDMEIGDFFYIGDYSRERMQSVTNNGRNWEKSSGTGFKFCTRKTEDKRIIIIRIA